jgi:uncharacterized membrane protein YgcG
MKRLVTSPIILSSLLVGTLPLFVATSASASAAYPGLVKSYFNLDTAPGCDFCHNTPSGGPGNINGKVGAYITGAPVNLENAKSSIDSYLDNYEATQDSDGGDEPDIDELKAGRDPNDSSDDQAGGGSAGAGGGASGAGGGSSGGGGGDDDDDDDDDDGGSSGNPGTSGQATSAGCSYGVLDSTTKTSTTAALVVAAGLVASLGKRRKRR